MDIPKEYKLLQDLKKSENRTKEKALEEMLDIFKGQGQGNISMIQSITFGSTLSEYSGEKKQDYLERYLDISRTQWGEDCLGI